MADDWGFRFLEDWLKEHPQPLDAGRLPDAFLRAFYIEDEVRCLREKLEAMPFEELAGRAGVDFKALIERSEKLRQLRDFAAAGTEARRRDAQARDIERHCRELKSSGQWVRGESAKAIAVKFGCEVRHVQNISSQI